ncbi:MAG: hypothetical protein K6T31_06990 [Alicyclobacillus sp.]|nr:hypothetical protein [Alicyclobacillus sp.]
MDRRVLTPWFWIPANALAKWLGWSALLGIARQLDPHLALGTSSIAWTVTALTLTGTVADELVLPRLGNARSLALGVWGMVFCLWGCPRLTGGSGPSLGGAVTLSLPLGVYEACLHVALLRLRRLAGRLTPGLHAPRE